MKKLSELDEKRRDKDD